MNRKDLQSLSRTRLAEAKALLASGHPDGAYYLAGYAIECALKACIAKGTQRHDFPDKILVDRSYTHSIKELVRVANLEEARRAVVTRDRFFERNWDLVLRWSEQSRYLEVDPQRARDLIDAIGHRKHGVMQWLKHYW